MFGHDVHEWVARQSFMEDLINFSLLSIDLVYFLFPLLEVQGLCSVSPVRPRACCYKACTLSIPHRESNNDASIDGMIELKWIVFGR